MEPGGNFFSLSNNTLSEYDLAGNETLETNVGILNEQLAAKGYPVITSANGHQTPAPASSATPARLAVALSGRRGATGLRAIAHHPADRRRLPESFAGAHLRRARRVRHAVARCAIPSARHQLLGHVRAVAGGRADSAGLSRRQPVAAYRQYVAGVFRGGRLAAHAPGRVLGGGFLRCA